MLDRGPSCERAWVGGKALGHATATAVQISNILSLSLRGLHPSTCHGWLTSLDFFLLVSLFVPVGVLHRGPSREGASVRGEALGKAAMGQQRQRGHPVIVRVPALPGALPADQEPASRPQPAGISVLLILLLILLLQGSLSEWVWLDLPGASQVENGDHRRSNDMWSYCFGYCCMLRIPGMRSEHVCLIV